MKDIVFFSFNRETLCSLSKKNPIFNFVEYFRQKTNFASRLTNTDLFLFIFFFKSVLWNNIFIFPYFYNERQEEQKRYEFSTHIVL